MKKWTGPLWELVIDKSFLIITQNGQTRKWPREENLNLEIRWSWFRWKLWINNQPVLLLKGLNKKRSKLITLCLNIEEVEFWSHKFEAIVEKYLARQIWIPKEVIDDLVNERPRTKLLSQIRRFALMDLLDDDVKQALRNLEIDLPRHFEEMNKQILAAELESQKEFLDQIEQKPLSDEQACAVLTFDNRVLLVAAAGSGKTSVMVARAAYAVRKKIVSSTKILLLAFNRAAADELQERVKSRLSAVNIDSTGIRASTFHSFGLSVIGNAVGARPKIAPWVDKGTEIEELDSIVQQLKSNSQDFKYKWDLYRLIFTPDTMKMFGVAPDTWDKDSRQQMFRTFDGKVVRSHGEKMIANWLYLNGVTYEYEGDYVVSTADELHSQYTPDFYYPTIDTWHEHWALDSYGNPPESFHGYRDGIEWKRNLHRINETSLIETTFGSVVFGNGLKQLQVELETRGIELDWNPEREKHEFTNIEESQLIRLIGAFLRHIKSNSLDMAKIEARLEGDWKYLNGTRTNLFLEIFWPIYNEWNLRLKASGAIDFEDMLVEAATHIENGNHLPDFDLILVDEFQDSSAARGKLIKAILQRKGKFVLVVGDDWQSINRFAGADLSQMSQFHERFGDGPTLQLTKTFRYTQEIANVASNFVMKNPSQMQKSVISEIDEAGDSLVLVRATDEKSGVREALKRISDEVKLSGEEKMKVFVLGRYNFNIDWLPEHRFSNLTVNYKTVHGSKGLECDYVVIVNFEAGTHGFPSEIEDDPILNLAMSEVEEYDYAEERRLLYVALTRAKKRVYMVTRENRDSKFAVEMIDDKSVEIITNSEKDNEKSTVVTCKGCSQGIMVKRSGPFGEFYGCSRFPKCIQKAPFPK